MVNKIVYGVLLLSAALIVAFWGNWLTIGVIVLLTYPAMLITGFLVGVVMGPEHFEDQDAETDDIQELDRTEDIQILEASKNIIGRFMDADIYEWVKVEYQGQIHKLDFVSVLRDGEKFESYEDFFVTVQPGMVYTKPTRTDISQ